MSIAVKPILTGSSSNLNPTHTSSNLQIQPQLQHSSLSSSSLPRFISPLLSDSPLASLRGAPNIFSQPSTLSLNEPAISTSSNENKTNKESNSSSPEATEEELFALRTLPFFGDWSESAVLSLAKLFTRKNYPAGALVVEEGQSGTCFYLLVKGKVRVTAKASSPSNNSHSKSVELTVIDAPNHFGIDTLLQPTLDKEAVTVTTVTPSYILSLTHEAFQQYSRHHPTPPTNTLPVKVHLKDIPFFSDLNDIKLRQLATLLEFRRCREREEICRQGDEADGFYILVSGEIDVTATGHGGQSTHKINQLRERDWFGEIALTQNTKRTATLTTVTPCLLLYLSSSRFQTFLSLAPELRDSIDAIIYKRTANSLKAITLFSSLDDATLDLLGQLFRFQYFPQDCVIFKEGDPADAFFVIQKGVVGVTVRGSEEEELLSGECESGSARSGDVESDSGVDSDSNSTNRRNSASGSGSSSPAGPSELHLQNAVNLPDLTKNDWFGEIALVSKTKRTATVYTKTPCIMLKLQASDFHRFLTIVPQLKTALQKVMSIRTAQTLSHIPFFKQVKENKRWSKLGILGPMFVFEHFNAGDWIVREGEIGDKFYVLIDGLVEVCKNILLSNGSAEVVRLETLGKNDWFGEMALVKETPRLTSIQCVEDCLCLTVTRETFHQFMKIQPDVVDHFSTMVTYRTSNLLRSIKVFDTIQENKPWSKLELLSSMFNYEYVASGVEVMKAGTSPVESNNKFFIIALGSVQAERPSEMMKPARNIENKRTNGLSIHTRSTRTLPPDERSKVLGKGCYFDELSFFTNSPRTLTVTTRETTVFLTLTRAKFHQFSKVAPEIKLALAARYPNYAPDQSPDPVSPFRADSEGEEEETKEKGDYSIFVALAKMEEHEKKALTDSTATKSTAAAGTGTGTGTGIASHPPSISSNSSLYLSPKSVGGITYSSSSSSFASSSATLASSTSTSSSSSFSLSSSSSSSPLPSPPFIHTGKDITPITFSSILSPSSSPLTLPRLVNSSSVNGSGSVSVSVSFDGKNEEEEESVLKFHNEAELDNDPAPPEIGN